MEIVESRSGAQTELFLKGRLDAVSCKDLEQKFTSCFEAGVVDFTLDLSKLDYISSAGLRVLLWARKNTAGKNGQIVLRAPNDRVQTVIDLSGLASFFALKP